jgi:hypothetical protein
MTTTELDKEDVFNHIINKAKQYSSSNTVENIKKERREWKEHQEKVRREHQQNPILYYCDKIRGIVPEYEISFKDAKKMKDERIKERDEAPEKFLREEYAMRLPSPDEMPELERRVFNTEVWKHEEYEKRRAEHNAEYDTKHTKPEGMTKKQWQKEKSRKRKLKREEEKEQKLNRDFEFRNSPQRMFYKMIDSIDCECEAEKMRVGIFCETCVLISRVRQYMLDLFKDAAEGRSSYI